MGHFVVIGSDGFPLIIYKDTVGFDLWSVHCTDALCNGRLKCTQIDTIHDIGYGGSISLAIGRDGLGVIELLRWDQWRFEDHPLQ